MARRDKVSEPLSRSGDVGSLEPLPGVLLDDPLQYLIAEHVRQRAVCAVLRNCVSQRSVARTVAGRVAEILAVDVPLHHDDEECDLFQALTRRARPEDDLAEVIARLIADHAQSKPLRSAIVRALTTGVAHDAPNFSIAPQDAAPMAAYAEREHRHLAIENGIVLAIARKRLNTADLRAISRTMKARRGLEN
jgi:hemerythrin-like domain-containing protein